MHPGSKKGSGIPMTTQTTTGTGMEGGGPSSSDNYGTRTMDHHDKSIANDGEMDYNKPTNSTVTTAVEATSQ
jgi:hypothetical protein